MSILKIARDFSPVQLSSGQIKLQCPFTENHSASSRNRKQMFFSPEINAYHCFSCHAKGRLTTLLVDKFDVPLFEAVELVHLVEYKKEKKESLVDTLYYWDLTPPQEFLDRKFSAKFLLEKKVGLLADGTIAVPMYWGSVLKGIKFRKTVKGKREFWYSENFDKENYLYNGDKQYKDYVVLVEGESDSWRLSQWNINNYALLGTEMSDWQAEQISKTGTVFIASDKDEAGLEAAYKWYNKLKLHTDVMFLDYNGNDPADCKVRNSFVECIDTALNYAEFKYLTEQQA